jgi:hypothetical protein
MKRPAGALLASWRSPDLASGCVTGVLGAALHSVHGDEQARSVAKRRERAAWHSNLGATLRKDLKTQDLRQTVERLDQILDQIGGRKWRFRRTWRP